MKKNRFIVLGAALFALSGLSSIADYVAQDFISPRTGKSAVFWGDASKGKDAYILEYDEATDHYYFKKVEKNFPTKPAAHAKKAEKAVSENK